jgi:CheY-like chemotaxis protein/HPt (histidine-containing phosphotransfer) domain-containing protein
MMGGEIGVEPEEGKGSTFWFTAVFSKQTGLETELAKEKVDLSNMKVLVVDDNETNRKVLTEYLGSWGCLPVEAPDGKEALAILMKSVLLKEPFKLILTDFQMSTMNGFDLARDIRAIEALNAISIIVLTSARQRGDGKISKDIGIQGYLTKPIKKNDLREAIEMVVGLPTEGGLQTGPQLVTVHTLAERHNKKVRILLAEDYPTNQQVAMAHLQEAGYQVTLAEDGQQAVESCKQRHYDLILMDIQMPVMDGYEASKAIRNLEVTFKGLSAKEGSAKLERVPIIAMTANAMKDDRGKCLEAGMNDYVAKPLRRKELLALVDRWIMSKSGSAAQPHCEQTTGNTPETDAPMHTDALDQDQATGNPIEVKAPMNFEKAVEEFMGKEDILMSVLKVFLDNVGDQIETIRQAISEGNVVVVGKEAHSIKGGAANLTADDLSRRAFDLENIAKSGILEGGVEAFERLENDFFNLKSYAEDKFITNTKEDIPNENLDSG